MQITIKGEMTMAAARQAPFEQLHELEDLFAVSHTIGIVLYVNPSNGVGDAVTPHHRDGRELKKIFSDGPYRSAAEDFKI